MLKLSVKLDKDMKTLEVSAQRGKKILSTTKDSYQKDLSDKIINGLAHSISSVQAMDEALCMAKKKKFKRNSPEGARRVEGLDKNLICVRLKKQEQIRGYFISESSSFVSNLIGNSVISVFNWLRKKY